MTGGRQKKRAGERTAVQLIPCNYFPQCHAGAAKAAVGKNTWMELLLQCPMICRHAPEMPFSLYRRHNPPPGSRMGSPGNQSQWNCTWRNKKHRGDAKAWYVWELWGLGKKIRKCWGPIIRLLCMAGVGRGEVRCFVCICVINCVLFFCIIDWCIIP